jgi:autotransporter adhesin
VQKQAYAGTAVGLAAAGLRYDDRPGKLSTAAAFGYYHGQTGFAGGVGATSNDGKWRVNAAASLTPGNGIRPDFGVSAGVAFTWN